MCEKQKELARFFRSHKVVKTTRDSKPWYKPPKEFKVKLRRQFRAQSRAALFNHLRAGRDFLPPMSKKKDVWEWT